MLSVSLIDDRAEKLHELESALRAAAGPLQFTIRHRSNPVAADFPQAVVHAIVFTPRGVVRATASDVAAIKSATKPGTCRVYLWIPSGAPSATRPSPLDDFIQRSTAHDASAVANQIIAFFNEADAINRRCARLYLRDSICLRAYAPLSVMWPLSYVVVALHIINTLALLAGRSVWPAILANAYIVAAASFFGAFFVVHTAFVDVRNALFVVRIVKRWSPVFALGAGALALAAVTTAYSVVALNNSILRVVASAAAAASLYVLYMYARRIRAECTSLSELHAAIANPSTRSATLLNIGRQPLTPASFPLFRSAVRAVFISYMHESAWSTQTAGLAFRCSQSTGFEVWMDQSSIPSGGLWRQHLLRGLGECGLFVAVLDPGSAATDWVLTESAFATMLRKDVGKPRFLLIARSAEDFRRLQAGEFGVLYRNLLRGAADVTVLLTDEEALTPEAILRASKR